jgi:iron complex transport system substrate-binding protein
VYETVLCCDLLRSGWHVERQRAISFDYDGMHFEEGFRVDLVVGEAVVVEIKAVAQLAPVHARQVLTYLRLMDYRVGLLINVGALHLRDGITRLINSPMRPAEGPASSARQVRSQARPSQTRRHRL